MLCQPLRLPLSTAGLGDDASCGTLHDSSHKGLEPSKPCPSLLCESPSALQVCLQFPQSVIGTYRLLYYSTAWLLSVCPLLLVCSYFLSSVPPVGQTPGFHQSALAQLACLSDDQIIRWQATPFWNMAIVSALAIEWAAATPVDRDLNYATTTASKGGFNPTKIWEDGCSAALLVASCRAAEAICLSPYAYHYNLSLDPCLQFSTSSKDWSRDQFMQDISTCNFHLESCVASNASSITTKELEGPLIKCFKYHPAKVDGFLLKSRLNNCTHTHISFMHMMKRKTRLGRVLQVLAQLKPSGRCSFLRKGRNTRGPRRSSNITGTGI